jgi:hypothetical protein
LISQFTGYAKFDPNLCAAINSIKNYNIELQRKFKTIINQFQKDYLPNFSWTFLLQQFKGYCTLFVSITRYRLLTINIIAIKKSL